MELRIKELLKERGMRMADIASKLGTDQSNLSKSLGANPSLSRLVDVADALGVEVTDLFVPQKKDIFGCLYVNGKPHLVNSREEIETLLAELG